MDCDVSDETVETFERLFGPGVTPRPNIPEERANCSLAAVAAELGVSTARVRQIEQQALARCRRILEAAGYDISDLL